MTTTSQNSNNVPILAPEAHQFDFWIGEWAVTWADGGLGTNNIHTIMDGFVILENFEARPTSPFRGMSISVFSLGKWRQTWADNNGGYLDFVGEFRDGTMELRRRAILDGKPIVQRMVWYNIARDELDWNWERSEDGGKTWTVLWQIHYQRKRPAQDV
jgi:hypothetical protein